MDVPLTSAGKPCKLCKAKGRKCHLHGGTLSPPKGGKTSPKSSPKKYTKVVSNLDDLFGTFDSPTSRAKSPPKTPKEFQYLQKLPKPALQQVLLSMEWSDLRKVCSHVSQAFRICQTENFRKMYMARNRMPLFLDPQFQKKIERHGTYDMWYKDSRGTEIDIQYLILMGELIGSIKIFFFTGLELRIELDNYGNVAGVFSDPKSNKKDEEKSLNELFTKIQRQDWIGMERKPDLEQAEILKTIVRELKAALGKSIPNIVKRTLETFLQ